MLGARASRLAIACLTIGAFAIRVSNFRQGLFGDEFSTAWVVEGRGLGRVLSIVHSDAEVTPPLSFVLSWLTAKIGSGHEWLRLPSLVAGTVTIPLIYAVGRQLVSRTAGLVAAAAVTLSPMMIYYSTEARAYALMVAFLAGSTLAMLTALRGSRRRWWVVYGGLSCLALYSHYTAAFPLAAQLLWLLWAHPGARVPAILANVGAAVAYVPWIPGYVADTKSVTIPLVNVLFPLNFHAARLAVEQWALGYPYVTVRQVPGIALASLIVAGIALAGAGALGRVLIGARRSGEPVARSLARIPKAAVLVAALALSAPVGEAIYSAVGTHVLGTRNLNASWPGLALAIGALVAAAPRALGVVSCALVLVGYGGGAVKSLESRWARPDYPGVASFIDAHAGPRDVVVDGAVLPAVVPLTGPDAYLRRAHREFRPGLPKGPPPYTFFTPVPPVAPLLAQAIRDARGARIFLVAALAPTQAGSGRLGDQLAHHPLGEAGALLSRLPPGYRIVETRVFVGLEPLGVLVISTPAR